ncbi:M48 family metalloprotease [Parvularcula sp. LCG005]|uniref:M48 family metalloprotease n=1 Tax=Parvularcula sp. LCG005 TaxID=3078805 RepID=UPI002943DF7F|nr:M48 family metalloprotease [Parvularcula sp. LCG005]WOI52108.1 M48 family metalloprotease [Parvularcula sp. LCG005]
MRRFSISVYAALAVSVLSALVTSAHSQTLLRDAEIEQYLEDYANPLFVAAGLDPNAVEIYLIGDQSLNAFVTAGLKVFVHTGLITAADNPNQIEGVLAHETGHLAGGHQQRGSEAMAQASRPAMLSLVLGAIAVAAGSPEAGMSIMGLGQNIALGEFLAYNQGQESAADQAAVTYLEQVGHSGEGLVEFFSKLSNRQLLTAYKIDPYLQTHPLAIKRMNRLRDRVASQTHAEVTDSEEAMFRLKMIQAKILGFVSDPYTTLRQYPLSDQTPPARYARAVAYYRSSRLEDALKETNRLIEFQPENPFFQELKGQMLFEHGKIAESVEPHRRSVELAPQYALLKINLARALVALEKEETTNEAVTILRTALQMEPRNSFGWSELARAEAFLGDEAEASLAQAQAYFAVGNYPGAHRFASRARDLLEVGTPEHLQALDIVVASEEEAYEAMNRRERRR